MGVDIFYRNPHSDISYYVEIVFTNYTLNEADSRFPLEVDFIQFFNTHTIGALLSWKFRQQMSQLNIINNGSNLLHFAAKFGLILVAKWLLEHRFNINDQNGIGETALYIAIDKNHVEMTRLLLSKGANPNICQRFHRYPIHVANDADIVDQLIKAGADINARAWAEGSPLFIAYIELNRKKVALLIAAGAVIDEMELHRAQCMGSESALWMLEEQFGSFIASDREKKIF